MSINRVLLIPLAVAVAAMAWVGVVQSKPKPGQVVTVRVIRAKVMRSPRFIGPVAGNVSRGQQLTFKGARGDWYQVAGRASGWIHRTNVTDKRVRLSSTPGGGSGGASRSEVELAGRGFTPQVEDRYRSKHPNLDFSHVDAIEKTELDPAGLESFVKQGGLSLGGTP